MIDRFVALAEFTAQKLVQSGLTARGKISVLGKFLLDPLPDDGSFKKRAAYVIYIGRLYSEKGAKVMLESIAGLPRLELKIVGNGIQAESLHAMAREQGLSNAKFL